jgi:hypothetical protein
MEGTAQGTVRQRQRGTYPVLAMGEGGFFQAIWPAGLAEQDAMAGIAWRWQRSHGAARKAPPAAEQIGRHPLDQGKGGKRHLLAPGYLLQASEPGVVRSNGAELVPALS